MDFLCADTAPVWRAGINKQEAVIRGRIKTEFLPTHRRPRPRRTQPRESTDSLDLPLSTVRSWAKPKQAPKQTTAAVKVRQHDLGFQDVA